MRLISWDDFIELGSKIKQRGWGFIASKLNLNAVSRTKSAFDESLYDSSNWWIIPAVRARWNEKITGSKEINYEQYLVEQILNKESSIRMLSIGCGVASHEIELAQYEVFEEITAVDLVGHLLQTAEKVANDKGIKKMKFLEGDFTKMKFEEPFDLILFHASLHHFYDIDALINKNILPLLSPKAYLVINEYVGPNRLQYPVKQIKAINAMLDFIPTHLKRRLKSNRIKNSYYGPGWLRMIVADPSECADSKNILPVLRSHFNVGLEKPYGGNLLMGGLKDIAHHFVQTDSEGLGVLQKLFELEDQYLENNESDFVFGVYQKKS